MTYDFGHLAGVSDLGDWHLSRERGRKKTETQQASDILVFISLSSSLWGIGSLRCDTPVELTSFCLAIIYEKNIAC